MNVGEDNNQSLVIENRALIHLSNIMIANARAHKFKEMATLAKSVRANERFMAALDTFIGLVGSKHLSDEHAKTLKEATASLEKVEDSTDKAPVKTKALKKILNDIESIIRANRWHDMPRHGGTGMSLIEEFYGIKPGDEGAASLEPTEPEAPAEEPET